MGRQKTIEEFKHEVYDLVGNEYKVNSKYNNARTKINIIHNKCGYKDWWVTPHNFLIGKRCPKCAGNLSTDTQGFNTMVEQKTNHGWCLDQKSKYINNITKVRLVHRACGHTKDITPKSFKQNGVKCSYCLRMQKEFKKQKEKEKYDGLTKKQYDQHKMLAKLNRKSSRQFEQEFYREVGNSYALLSKYQGSSGYIHVLHNKCGRDYWVRTDKFMYGKQRCNCSGMSQGENLIKDYLDKHHIDYVYGYIMPNKLHLDFYLPNEYAGIEFDGIQHFKPRGLFGGKRAFVKTRRNDKRKDQYCKSMGLKLIRIPYTILNHKLPLLSLSDYINL